MKRVISLLVIVFLFAQEGPEEMSKKIFDKALTGGKAYNLLRELCLGIGNRISGSENAEKAVSWGKKTMEKLGFESVFLQNVMVPHWVRGRKESVFFLYGNELIKLNGIAIGGSVATTSFGRLGPVLAEVLELSSFDEIDKIEPAKMKRKIIFLNEVFDQREIETGAGYSKAVRQRVYGASKVAKNGAVALVIRSVSSADDDIPHTGTLVYEEGVPKIPAMALGVKSAEKLSQLLKKYENGKLEIRINSHKYEDKLSHNVIGEIKGSEKPSDYIVVGGHLDSWDVGQGAHDDGAGVVQSIEALRILKEIGYKPRHTLRTVLFMNEENGLAGALEYVKVAKERGYNHIAAIESDGGGFSPRGFNVNASESVIEKIRPWLQFFDKNTITYFTKGSGGADVDPLNKEFGTPTFGLNVDSQRYFDIHHTSEDTFDKVNKRELHLGAASMALLIYLIDQNEL